MSLKEKFFVNSFRKMYFIIIALVIFITIVCYYITVISFISSEKRIIKANLHKLTLLLKAELEDSFNDILLKSNTMDLPDERKIQILKNDLQPFVNKISGIYKDYGLGYYSIELDSILAVSPNYKLELLNKTFRKHPYYKLSETGKKEYFFSGESIGWYGKSIYNLTNPVVRNNKIIGHAWSNYRLNDIYSAAKEKAGHIYIIGSIILVMMLLMTNLIIYFYKKQLNYISQSLFNNEELNPGIFSEVKPIIEKIKNRQEIIITQKKELARLERFHTIGEMAATLAHEVRNPLATIDGYIQFMELKVKDNNIVNKLNIIRKELINVNSVINAYLSFARDRVSNKERKNLNEIIMSIQPLLQSDANRNRKSIIFDLKKIAPLNLNEKEMRQLIFNISRNGLEAMDDGGTLTIKTYEEQEKVVLAISDEGTGIPSDILDKIKEPFFTTKKGGTGIGLSVCYRIVEEHNATIDIETNKKGTTFYIKFD